jgi:hypothetical protein
VEPEPSSTTAGVVEVDDGAGDVVTPPETDSETTGSTTVEGPAEGDVPDGDPPLELRADGEVNIIDVISRNSWGAEAPGRMVPHDLRLMTIHHTAGPAPDPADPAAAIRSHQRFHQGDRQWPDIAYHFLIGPAGEVFEGRNYNFAGDTGTDYDPAGHFLVSIDGDYSATVPNDAQITAAAALFAWASATFDLPLDTLGAHRDYASTQCPGDALYSVLTSGRLAGEIERILSFGLPELSYTWG